MFFLKKQLLLAALTISVSAASTFAFPIGLQLVFDIQNEPKFLNIQQYTKGSLEQLEIHNFGWWKKLQKLNTAKVEEALDKKQFGELGFKGAQFGNELDSAILKLEDAMQGQSSYGELADLSEKVFGAIPNDKSYGPPIKFAQVQAARSMANAGEVKKMIEEIRPQIAQIEANINSGTLRPTEITRERERKQAYMDRLQVLQTMLQTAATEQQSASLGLRASELHREYNEQYRQQELTKGAFALGAVVTKSGAQKSTEF
jgi:site-specific recombinase